MLFDVFMIVLAVSASLFVFMLLRAAYMPSRQLERVNQLKNLNLMPTQQIDYQVRSGLGL